ncbi:MBOAT family protein [Aneurinibacillus sp. Ricciae_BoGa-3]|uniref:MBOAT family O-acyltransferase n=1 Tax=Aneurinibacillus sp. Ricciae_BoGa-3 TaxID=3022697 RepID=UPI002340C564|nr:MBOAT family protein [Aneurinibacillus sp. Ricciae_BoGa-3]WCK55551.1 MBOAT family protein [Aneurinibacillus sp. Ricciae_BoGa-3]
MLFNSYAFILVFLPITLCVFFLLGSRKKTTAATVALIMASLVFYSYWDKKYLVLLLASILFNYFTGTYISRADKPGRKRALLLFGVAIDLILLGYYKYTNFFIESWNGWFHEALGPYNIALPLGISFFTFTQIAYLMDSYRGETKEYNLLTYSLFVTFFPHLIAGPILHHRDIIPQFHRLRNFVFSHKNMAAGIVIFIMGLGKKVLIADSIAGWAAPVFAHAHDVNAWQAWIGAISYTFQLYFDFSGYSDMAIGLGLMLNIRLPINFNSPYKAESIIDFWRRWHITLSAFLKDYMYITLGGNRHGKIKKMRNLFITMLLGGLWHGAGWTFVIWGALHGLYLMINHGWRTFKRPLPRPIGWLVTFVFVVIAWVFFRAQSLGDAWAILQAMFGMGHGAGSALPVLTALANRTAIMVDLAALLLWVVLLPNTMELAQRFKPNWRWALALGCVAFYSLLELRKVSEFLYFQF